MRRRVGALRAFAGWLVSVCVGELCGSDEALSGFAGLAEGDGACTRNLCANGDFPNSETFGLRMQLRRSAVSVASNIAEGHGRLTDAQLHNSLGIARGSLYEMQTQLELAQGLGFLEIESFQFIMQLSTETAKLINGLIGVLHVE